MEDTQEKFPLIVYEMTREYENLLTKEQERLDPLIVAWRNRGGTYTCIATSWRFNEEGQYEFWLNDDLGIPGTVSVEIAQKLALHHGTSGWWTVDEFEQFVLEGSGPIFERTMHRLGFRKGGDPSCSWVRNKEGERSQNDPETVQLRVINDQGEINRLVDLLVMESEDLGCGRTMNLTVHKSGMVFAYLKMNPFGGTSTETMGAWAAGFKVRGHLAKQQEGYTITAEEIIMFGTKFIYITTEGDCKTKECLWPISIGRGNFIPLLKKFVEGVN
jgi:hypothetical protein